MGQKRLDCLQRFKEACKIGCQSSASKILGEHIDLKKIKYSESSPVHIAVENNRLDILKSLLSKGAVLDVDNGFESLLDIADEHRYAKLCQFLLAHGANKCDLKNHPALLIKCLTMAILHDLDKVVELLIRRGTYPSGDPHLDHKIFTYFIAKNNVGMVKTLSDKTTDTDFSNLAKQTSCVFTKTLIQCRKSPLCLAAELNRLEIAEILLQKGAKVNFSGYGPGPPLHLAVAKGNFEMMKLLMKNGADPELIHTGSSEYSGTPLGVACREGQVRIVEHLLSSGVNVNKICDHGVTALHLACMHHHPSKENDERKEARHVKCVELLLRHSAKIDAVDSFGETALFPAIYCPRVAQLLLESGADPNVQNCKNESPLLLAVKRFSPRQTRSRNRAFVHTVEILLKHRADPEMQNSDEDSAITFAIAHQYNYFLRLMLKSKLIEINRMDGKGKTLLDRVTFRSDHMSCKILNTLLHFGADFRVKTRCDEIALPLQRASEKREALCSFITYFDKVRLLGFVVEDKCWLKNEVSKLYGSELEKLENVVVNFFPKITLYDFLFVNRNRCTKFLTNERFLQVFSENGEDFEKNFPYYGVILNQKFKRGAVRRKLLDAAVDALETVLANRLPEICSEKIFFYFNECQLEVLSDFKLE